MKIYTAEEHSRDKTVTPFALIACIIVHTRHVVVKANQIAPTKSTMKLKILMGGGRRAAATVHAISPLF
jgi:hypothetical protein